MNETDHVHNQLCARIEELEKEKLELNEQLDSLQIERDILERRVVGYQDLAVDIALQKSKWQSEALQELYNTWKGEGMMRVGALLDKAIELQEEVEGGEV